MSVGDINDQVYSLIHQLILADQADRQLGGRSYQDHGGNQSWGAAASRIRVGGANLMDDSALIGLK